MALNTLFPTDWKVGIRCQQVFVPDQSATSNAAAPVASAWAKPLVVKVGPPTEKQVEKKPPAGKYVRRETRYIETWMDVSNRDIGKLFEKYKVKEIKCDKHYANFNPDKTCKTCIAKQIQGTVYSQGKGNSGKWTTFWKHVIDIPEKAVVNTCINPEGWSFKADGKTFFLTLGNVAKNPRFKQSVKIIDLMLGTNKIENVIEHDIGQISEENQSMITAIFNQSMYDNVCQLYKKIAMTGFRILLTKQPDYFDEFKKSPFFTLYFADPVAYEESCDDIRLLNDFIKSIVDLDDNLQFKKIDLKYHCNNITFRYFKLVLKHVFPNIPKGQDLKTLAQLEKESDDASDEYLDEFAMTDAQLKALNQQFSTRTTSRRTTDEDDDNYMNDAYLTDDQLNALNERFEQNERIRCQKQTAKVSH